MHNNYRGMITRNSKIVRERELQKDRHSQREKERKKTTDVVGERVLGREKHRDRAGGDGEMGRDTKRWGKENEREKNINIIN